MRIVVTAPADKAARQEGNRNASLDAPEPNQTRCGGDISLAPMAPKEGDQSLARREKAGERAFAPGSRPVPPFRITFPCRDEASTKFGVHPLRINDFDRAQHTAANTRSAATAATAATAKPRLSQPRYLGTRAGSPALFNGSHRRLPAMLTRIVAATCISTLLAAAPAMADVPLSKSPYLKQVKVKPQQARAEALKAYDGKIVSEELEHEEGGSGLRYSFDIKKNGVIHEVGIDARSGQVLENSIEGPHAD
jgi:hypothetical protein